MRRGVAVVLACLFAFGLTSCGITDDSDSVLVMAASSLTDAFADIEVAFESANPGVDIRLNLAGSGALREQILDGAPADVFASANDSAMRVIVDGGQAAAPIVFASNEMVIAVPKGNPASIAGIEDLADASLLIGLCAEEVPCGEFARQALEQAGVTPSVDTNEAEVRSLLTKIELGELDAGLVYTTDVASTSEVEALPLPAGIDIAINYPIAQLTESPNPTSAAAFIDFVLSPAGQQILADHGFTP